MARIPNGILGDFIGTAGNISGYVRNGRNFIGTRRRKSAIAMTPQRLAQQQKIKVCNEFTKPFSGKGFFNKTFPAYGDTGTGYNRATSAIMNLTITGNYPDMYISFPLVLISKGQLPAAENASAAINATGNVLFTWTDNTGTRTARAGDKVILVAFFPGLHQIIYSMNAGTRSDSEAILVTQNMHD